MNYYFTSDHHFFHSKIIEYSSRPFSSISEMNGVLIDRWNEKIKKGDIVYHLGDFGFFRGVGIDTHKEVKSFLSNLNGSINLILGNHDCQNYNQKVLSLFASTSLLREKTIDNQRIIMCHYPFISWAGRKNGSIMLHGHCHYNLKITRKDGKFGKILDIGVDGNNFYPYSFDEIIEIMKNKPLSYNFDEFNEHHSILNY